jgi:hypothetical protein
MMNNRRRINITPLQPVSRSNDIPASLFQEDVFYNHLADKENVSLNVVSLYDIENCENGEIFCEVFDETVRKYEIFRTYFKLGKDKVFQVVVPESEVNFRLAITDISHLNDPAQMEYLSRTVKEFGYAPFDMQRLPLFRAKLFKLGNQKYVLFRVVHHSVIDLTTMNMLSNEMSELYEKRIFNKKIEQSAPQFQFADYCAWERNTFTPDFLKPQVEFWRNQYKDAPDTINLPFDFPRPAETGKNFKTASIDLSPEAWKQAKVLSRLAEASQFQTNLAIFSIFMNRYSGENDICVGSSIDLRRARNLPEMLGPLISEFSIRCRFDRQITCLEYIKELRTQSIIAYQNTDINFENLIIASGLKRKLNTYTLYQIEFSLKPMPKNDSFLKFKEIFWDSGVGDVDLSCRLNEQADTATVIFRYNGDLFLDSSITHMIQHYAKLYETIVSNPDFRIDQLPNLKPLKKIKATPAADSNTLHKTPTSPMNDFEKCVANIWQSVLGINAVSQNDNFFEIGGDLYKLVEVYRRLKQQNLNFELDELYRCPTISSLSRYTKLHKTKAA